MPCLSIKQRLLSLIITVLFFGLNQTIHAEGLSGLKGSLKKGNINEDNAIETPVQLPDIKAKKSLVLQQIQNNEKDNVIGAFVPKTIKIKNKGKITIPQFNYIKTPPNFLSIKTSKPQRISDPKLVPVEINSEKADFSYTPLPDDSELFNGITSTDEIQAKANAIKELRRLETEFHKNPPSSEYATYNLEAHAQIFVNENSKYPDLCALMRLVALEEFMKRSWQGLTQDNTYNNPQGLEAKYYIIGKFNEIIRYYSSYTDSTIASVITKSQNRIAQMNQYVQPHIESIKQRIALFIPYNEENKKYIKNFLADTYLDYQQSEFPRNIKYMYRGIFDNYNQLAAAYYLTRNYSQLALLEKEMDDYYAQISPKVTIKFKTPQGAIFEKTFENIKEPDAYLSVKANVVLQSAKSILFDENCPLEYNDIKTKSEEIIKQIDNAEPPYPDYLSSVKRNLEYYKQRPIIKKIKFYKDEKTPMDETEICNPTDRLIIKFEIENPIINGNYVLAYPFDIVLESSVSKRTRKITVKQNSFYVFYQETVQFNQESPSEPPSEPPSNQPTIAAVEIKRNDPPIGITYKNLINNTRDALKESIACFDSEGISSKLYMPYRENKYFFNDKNEHNCLGYSFDIKYSEANQNFYNKLDEKTRTSLLITDLTKSFLKAGGFEWIVLKPFNENVCSFPSTLVAVRNQADWFFVDAHGSGGDNSISGCHGGIVSDTSLKINIPPYEFLRPDGRSEYSEDIDVLILPLCHCLEWIGPNKPTDKLEDLKFSKGWHKVLPNGLILGYKNPINEAIGYEIVSDLSVKIEQSGKKLSPEEIAGLWHEVNAGRYYASLNTPNISEIKVKQIKETAPYLVTIMNDKSFSIGKKANIYRFSMLWPKTAYHSFDKYVVKDFNNINEGGNDE